MNNIIYSIMDRLKNVYAKRQVRHEETDVSCSLSYVHAKQQTGAGTVEGNRLRGKHPSYMDTTSNPSCSISHPASCCVTESNGRCPRAWIPVTHGGELDEGSGS